MHCPNCPQRNLVKNGKTKAGYQRYRCTQCNYTVTDSPNQHGGSQPLFDRPMTSQEIQERFRKRVDKK